MQITPIFANRGDDETECTPGSFAAVAGLWPALIAPWQAP
jgi:hypothetical protein